MSSRTLSGCLITSIPATCALPESGFSNVARILTVVVLPAPLGPSTLKTVPSATSSDKSSKARTLPLLYVLTRWSALTEFTR